ncbi:MAG: phage holin family protein [Ardenticatenaceae bacterium]|nr:phage holin family protein [Ardenticatenaceae bacterium]
MIDLRTNDQSSVATLVEDILENTRHLLRQEINLVKVELRSQLREMLTAASKGLGLLATGAVLGLVALAFLGLVLMFGLSAAFTWPLWLSALIVAVVYLVVAGVLALIGWSVLKNVNVEPGVKPASSGD